MQDTPIFDALVGLLNVPDPEDSESEQGVEFPGSAEDSDERPHEDGSRAEASCSWCGIPIWEGSPRFDWLTTDPVGEDSVEVAACSSEHLDLVQAQYRRRHSIEVEDTGSSTGAGESAVGASGGPAPSAPVPVPPAVAGDDPELPAGEVVGALSGPARGEHAAGSAEGPLNVGASSWRGLPEEPTGGPGEAQLTQSPSLMVARWRGEDVDGE